MIATLARAEIPNSATRNGNTCGEDGKPPRSAYRVAASEVSAKACDGDAWAYAGSEFSCVYGDEQVGELVSRPPSSLLALRDEGEPGKDDRSQGEHHDGKRCGEAVG